MFSSLDYSGLLEKWVDSALRYVYTPPDRTDLECYGTGYNNWGVQTHQKAFAAFAVLSSKPDAHKEKQAIDSGEMLKHSLKMLRFSLESHLEGNYRCLDGTKWGHTWVSTLGLERMAHGIDAVKEYLTDYDRRLLRKVMVSESNYLLDDYYRGCPEKKGEIQAGPVENNDPESNIWCGAHLLRTALMYPDEARVKEYVEKGTAFILNGISVSSDAYSKKIVNGRPVSQWYVGSNFFDSFALNHHRYLNIGYMVICLSNLAMLYFSYRLKAQPVPEFIYRHVMSLWKLVKLCTFPDGRLCRIGGDTRIRYCYCQDYAIPAWLMISDLYGDADCEKFERGWLKTVHKEFAYNGDGSFLSRRCKGILNFSPLYYTRLESDRAVTLSMGAYWRRFLKIPSAGKSIIETVKQTWYDGYHGALMQRGKNRISSFCWRAAQPPQGLCLPADRSDMAEWRWNCAGMLIGLGRENYHRVTGHKEYTFKGGFTTAGQTDLCSEGFIAEGQSGVETLGRHTIVFTALPDDATVIVMQRCISPSNRVYVKEIKGLLYNVPNDIFNNSYRRYYFEKGRHELKGCGVRRERVVKINSGWINIDNSLGIIGVYGSKDFFIYQPNLRQAGLRLSLYESKVLETGLWADEVCYPYKKGTFSVNPDTTLLDIGCVIITGQTAEDTAKQRKNGVYIPDITTTLDVRPLMVRGADRRWYLHIVNFHSGKAEVSVSLKENVARAESLTGKVKPVVENRDIKMVLGAGESDILKVQFKG
jgi:hypothetical protein